MRRIFPLLLIVVLMLMACGGGGNVGSRGGPLSFLPFLIALAPMVFICYRLAKEKGKNTFLWTVLGIIPYVNFFALAYLVGCANVVLDKKVDEILAGIFEEEEGEESEDEDPVAQ